MDDTDGRARKAGNKKHGRKPAKRAGVFPPGYEKTQHNGNKVDPKTVYQPRFTFDDWEAEDSK